MNNLTNACNFKLSCKHQAPWKSNSDGILSSLVVVKYDCKNDKNSNPSNTIQPDAETQTDAAGNNIAAIVAPILVLLLVAVAGVVFLYWRRRIQRQSGKPGKINNATLQTSVQNEAYFTTDKNSISASENPEYTYHIIDPNSIPDQVPVTDKTVDPVPQDDYHTIDPNKMDNESSSAPHDYFILESQAATYAHNEDASEYNRIQLDTHKIVADPNYHRLGTVDPENVGNYSHTAAGFHNKDLKPTMDGITEKAQQNSHDDYSHSDC